MDADPEAPKHFTLERFTKSFCSGLPVIAVAEVSAKRMPLYDCMLLLKPHIDKAALFDLVARVGNHVYKRNGVVTDIKSFGKIQLGYGIKKLDGRYFQGHLMQMTMMATPNLNKELHYLNKENRLLRWLLVKHRDTKYGSDFFNEEGLRNDLGKYRRSLFSGDEDDDDVDDDDDYEVEETTEQ